MNRVITDVLTKGAMPDVEIASQTPVWNISLVPRRCSLTSGKRRTTCLEKAAEQRSAESVGNPPNCVILAPQDHMEEPGEVTRLLHRVAEGDRAAEELLISLVYSELHRLAWNSLRSERAEHTLQATALVNEAYLCLCRNSKSLHDRAHFFRLSARIMRRILVDYARSRNASKRGDGIRMLPLDEDIAIADEQLSTALAVDEMLNRLAAISPRQAQIVEMKFFSGLSDMEIASLLNVARRTVTRDWFMARAWLHQQMKGR